MINAGWVGYGWHQNATGLGSVADKTFEQVDASGPDSFAVCHQVNLRYFNEAFGIEETPDLELLLQREPPWFSVLAGKHILFELCELHSPCPL